MIPGLNIVSPDSGVLIVNGERFIGNHEDRQSARSFIESHSKKGGKRELVVKSFGVKIDSIDADLREVVQWRRGKGFSVWMKVV